MLLSARPLADVQSVNSFRYANQIQFTEGDTPTFYFQLVDASLDRADEGFQPAGRRYMPAIGATLMVTLDSINILKKITRAATQPFPSTDPSIWAFTVLSSDSIRGTLPLKLTLTEGAQVTNANVQGVVMVYPKS